MPRRQAGPRIEAGQSAAVAAATGRHRVPARQASSRQKRGWHEAPEILLNIIAQLEQAEIERLGKTIPPFVPGDTVAVSVNVVEGTRKRVQVYEGVVIGRRNRGLNSAFTVRKISSGEGVERTFQLYSPLIAGIEVKRRGDVRRAKLYYLRELSGKKARIKERLPGRSAAQQAQQAQAAPAVEAVSEAPAQDSSAS